MKKMLVLAAWLVGVICCSCEQTNQHNKTEKGIAGTTLQEDSSNAAPDSMNAASTSNDLSKDEWNGTEENMPVIRLPEITASGLEVRGNSQFTAYSADEAFFFDAEQAELRSAAEESLEQIAASIHRRAKEGKVRIYSYTAVSASNDKQLAEQRVQAIKRWLVSNGHLAEKSISVHQVESEANGRIIITVMHAGAGYR